MKILLPFQDPYNRPLSHKIVSGGTEQFMKSIKDNFDTVVYQFPYEQISWSKESDKKEIAENIVHLAEAYKVDVIVSNFAQAVFNSQHLIKSNIPIMFVEHCVYPIPNVTYRWNQGIDRGHSMFLVSKWQEKKYKEMSLRTNIDVLKIAGYLNPSYCKIKPQIVEPEYDCGTIGRCDNGKNPFKLKDLTKNSDIKGLVITSETQQDKDLPYFKRHTKLISRQQGLGFWYNKDKKFKNKGRILWDLEYKDVMENIAKCKTYFSTWPGETWGITSMEALSCGIPVILNSDKDGDHASEIIPADKSHYVKIPKDDKDALVKAIKSFENVDRKAIQQSTWDKHNKEQWKKSFANAVDKTIEIFNKKNH
jgi:hypothetical protein